MSLYGGIDLHSNNAVILIIDARFIGYNFCG